MKKLSLCILAVLLAVTCTACGFKNSPAASVLGNTDELISQDQLKPQTVRKKAGYQLELPEKGEEIGVITMSTGEVIKLRFFPNEAPKAVYNFKLHAIQGYYDGLTFHRICENFMIQGGDPEGTGYGGESVWGDSFADEFQANLLNIDGSVSMANSGANTNGSQFFINATGGTAPSWDSYQEGFKAYKSDPDTFTANYGRWINMDKVSQDIRDVYNENGGNPHLDGSFSTTGEGHTVFAQVFEGMDFVTELSETKVDENDRPLTPVVIKSIEITTY